MHTSVVPLSLLVLWLFSSSTAFTSEITSKRSWGGVFAVRGGAVPEEDSANNNATVEEYVAAMKEKDRSTEGDDYPDAPAPAPSENAPSSVASAERGSDEPAVVGVKSHSQKKSNAVGDPDGDGDDSESESSDYSEEWEELEEFDGLDEGEQQLDHQVQIEVEVVEEDDGDDKYTAKKAGGGGVGVRLGRMTNRRRNRKDSWRSTTATPSQEQTRLRLLEAWMPHIYFPPTPSAISYLSDNARLLDSSSKNRLDRRTLYAGLLLEWGSISTKLTSRTRKYITTAASQVLLAALSMATQPQWRQSAPRTSGIRLYQDDEDAKASTLGMQETIAMALVRSFILLTLYLFDSR